MKTYLYLFILPVVLFNSEICYSQNNLTPLEITERFLGVYGFPEKNNYLCCEMKVDMETDSSMGQFIPDSVSRSFELLYQDSISAVTSVELSTSKFKQDWYFYFKKDTYWKIEAMRALAMTGLAAKVLEQYESVSDDSLKKTDSLISIKMDSLISAKKDSLKLANADSLELAKADSLSFTKFSILKFVRQVRLELSSDKELIHYFITHKNSFINLVNIFIEKFELLEAGAKKFSEDPEVSKSLDSLAIHSFSFGNNFSDGKAGYCFLIGGILDNMVGYFYEPDKTKVPKMSKSGFIMIRDMGNGWYLYKTT